MPTAIAAAIRAALLDIVEHRVPIAIAVARAAAAAVGDDAAPRERPAERRRRENANALGQMAELEHAGQRREAAAIVPKPLSVDPHDPAEVEATPHPPPPLRPPRQ